MSRPLFISFLMQWTIPKSAPKKSFPSNYCEKINYPNKKRRWLEISEYECEPRKCLIRIQNKGIQYIGSEFILGCGGEGMNVGKLIAFRNQLKINAILIIWVNLASWLYDTKCEILYSKLAPVVDQSIGSKVGMK